VNRRKRLYVCAALALAAALWGTDAAWAATQLPLGFFRGSILDRSSLFAETDPGRAGLEPTTISPQIGDESRTVFLMDAINFGVLSTDGMGVTRVVDTAPAQSLAGYVNGALTGMLFDVRIASTSDVSPASGPSPADPWQTYFEPGTRYTNSGGTDGAWTDLLPGAGGLLATTAAGYGGLLVVYDQVPQNTSWTGSGNGPWDWTEGTHATGDSALPTSDDFPTISDMVQPWLIAVLAPMPSAYGVPVLPTGNNPVGSQTFLGNVGGVDVNQGLAFANIIGGTGAGMFATDVFGAGLDIRIEYKLSLVPADGWASSSEDPVQFGIIPEPMAYVFFGTGLVGVLGLAARRRIRAA